MDDYTCLKCDGKGQVDSDLSAVRRSPGDIIVCPDCGGSGLDAPPEWEEKHGLENPDDWARREPEDGEPFLEEDVEDRPVEVIWKEELITP